MKSFKRDTLNTYANLYNSTIFDFTKMKYFHNFKNLNEENLRL